MKKGVLVFCYFVTNCYQFPLPSFVRKDPVQLQLGPLLRTSQGWHRVHWLSSSGINQKKNLFQDHLHCWFTGLVGWDPCFFAGHQPGLLLESRSFPQVQARWLPLQTLSPGGSFFVPARRASNSSPSSKGQAYLEPSSFLLTNSHLLRNLIIGMTSHYNS